MPPVVENGNGTITSIDSNPTGLESGTSEDTLDNLTTTEPASLEPDIEVGFIFLALSGLLLLAIIILCIWTQRPFKRYA